MDFYKKKMLA